MDKDKSQISDGYHTFEELYYHRTILFSIICRQNKKMAWRSKLHADGSMFENFFIAGITTAAGDYTYHCEIKYWELFNYIKELPNALEWDGHKPEDITRLFFLYEA